MQSTSENYLFLAPPVQDVRDWTHGLAGLDEKSAAHGQADGSNTRLMSQLGLHAVEVPLFLRSFLHCGRRR